MIIDVLDHGNVKLISHIGSDKLVCDAARVSIEGGVRKGKPSVDRDKKLINYLANNNHSSPFEHCYATFYIKAPIFVIRQWQRHRTQSYNEVSGRYSNEIFEDFYVPKLERFMEEQSDNRQGSGALKDTLLATSAQISIQKNSREMLAEYKKMCDAGVSNELARLILPLNIYTEMYASANLLNWSKFLNLRLHQHAQYEIRVYAEAIRDILETHFPISIEALVK